MIIMGFNQGMQPIAGYNYGARLYSRVTDVTRLTMALGGRSGYAGVLALPVGAVVDRPYVYE